MVKPLVPAVAIGFILLLAACSQEQAENQQKSDEEVTTALAQLWGVRPKRNIDTEQQDIEAAILIEAPGTGVDLGWGWNTFRAEPIPTVCVEFARNQYDSQTTTLAFPSMSKPIVFTETSAETSIASSSSKLSFTSLKDSVVVGALRSRRQAPRILLPHP